MVVDYELTLIAFKAGWFVACFLILFFALCVLWASSVVDVKLFKRFIKDKNLISEFVEWKEKRKDLKKELEL